MEIAGRLAQGGAPHAHDELGRRARPARARTRTTGAPGTTSSRSPTTGTAARRRRAPTSSCCRASSSTASCPRTATATCSGSASSATRPSSRASAATSPRPATGSSTPAASPTWRTRTGPAPARAASSFRRPSTGIEVFNAGCELEVGRGLSSVHWDELLEDGRLCPALVTDDSHHPGFDSGSRVDVDPCRARPREHPRRPAHRPLLREHRTADPRRRDDRRRESSSGARPPARSRC